MRRTINWVGRIVFGAGVVIALGFGAQQALASSSLVDCPYCDTNDDCDVCCYPETGDCVQNFVCVCL